MGNKFGRRRQVVDDKFTKPQGLYPIKDVDYKKLRKLILESKLAPCYPGGDECDFSHFEECPICFLHYPTLNRSRCCMKSICTECFLQMKNPNSARPTQCPFCKASNYAVEYRGVKSKEERGLEQVEEQKVIEAKIRMRQQELQEEEERMHKRLETSSSAGVTHEENSNFSTSGVVEGETLVSSHDSDATPLHRPSSLSIQQNRGDGFDLDLEDIMVMEAIWLSIQENGNDRQNYLSYENATPEQYSPPITPLEGPSSSSPSGGLACAIAALAECQQVTEDQSGNYNGHTSVSDTLPSSSRRPSRMNSKMSEVGDWGSIDHESVFAEAGTSYSSTDDEAEAILPPPPPPPLPPGTYTNTYASEDGSFQSVSGPIVPESFEEQMMLAMAVSLAEARSRTAAQGVAWN